MSTVDGTWEVHAHGAGVDTTLRVVLEADGEEVSGEAIDGDHRIPITGGRLDGDRLTFAMTVSEPIRAKLTAKLDVDGDRMTGSARANLLLRVDLTARRVAP